MYVYFMVKVKIKQSHYSPGQTLKVRAHWSAADGTDGDKIFFPLLVTFHRTLIRTGSNEVRQFRLGFWEGNLFPSGQRVRLTQRWSWSYRIAWRDTERKMLMLLANQRPALKWIASARRRKYDAVCLLSKNIATRPMRPFLPLRSSVRVPLGSKCSWCKEKKHNTKIIVIHVRTPYLMLIWITFTA
jgi:hypothetical protein